MPRNMIFLLFIHKTVQSPRQVFSVTGPNFSPSYLYFESSKLYLTGSSSPGYKPAIGGRASVAPSVPFPSFSQLSRASQIMRVLRGS